MQLPHTVDERRVVVPIGVALLQAEQPEGRDRLGLALELERQDRFSFDSSTYKPICTCPQDDFAGIGRLL